jgi:hypothetical protein
MYCWLSSLGVVERARVFFNMANNLKTAVETHQLFVAFR